MTKDIRAYAKYLVFSPEHENASDMEWEFTADNITRANKTIAQYPEGHQQAAAIPLLDLGRGTWHASFSNLIDYRVCYAAYFYW